MPKPLSEFNAKRRMSNGVRLQYERDIQDLTQQMIDGDLRVDDWRIQMLQKIKEMNIQQYNIGAGGAADFDDEVLKAELQKQWGHLRKFARTVKAAEANGKSLAFALPRARMYARSTQAMFWKSAIPVDLPQVPRDGQTECRTNCNCRLRFNYERDADRQITAVLVFWQLGVADHCKDCMELARDWNPKRFEVEAGEIQESADMRQAVRLLLADQRELPARVIEEMMEVA